MTGEMDHTQSLTVWSSFERYCKQSPTIAGLFQHFHSTFDILSPLCLTVINVQGSREIEKRIRHISIDLFLS